MKNMRNIIAISLIMFSMIAKAENVKSSETRILIVPNGLLTVSPIISDATFSKIAKKNNLSEKNFTQEDLKKLDNKFNSVTEKLRKEHVFEKIVQIAPKYGVSAEAVAACIIGEHVFNVTIADQFQSYFINIGLFHN